VIGACMFVLPLSAYAVDSKEELIKAAAKYEETTPILAMLESTANATISRAQGANQQKLRAVFDALDKNLIRSKILDLMAKHFTVDELNAMAGFYGSPIGQSINSKFPDYLAETNTVVQKSIMEALINIMGEQDSKK